jgi:hypothetical protein
MKFNNININSNNIKCSHEEDIITKTKRKGTRYDIIFPDKNKYLSSTTLEASEISFVAV